MFIGHIPAGYIVIKTICHYSPKTLKKKIIYSHLMFVGVMGSIFPDFDMLYFYLIDKKQHLHHGYWTHIPSFWLCVFLLLFTASFSLKKYSSCIYISAFWVNVFAHLLLDTIVGKIKWLYPISSSDFFLFNVPSVYNFWVWNFLLHWTFMFEIVLIVIAGIVFTSNIKKKAFNNVVQLKIQ